MFNVVIEKESYNKIDPLVIKEDINNIIQSIEEQLYNINISYRNHVRKIKNSIKSLDGVSESTLIVLENEQIDDNNLIHYLTNVLEISLDCVVSTLYEDKDFKPQLSIVNNLDDLLKIDHHNIKICNQIVEQCKELFTVYSEVNDKKISSTSFYEILDESIKLSLSHNKQLPSINYYEDEIYNKVIENLDNLIDEDLSTTYNNIKYYVASISEGLAPRPMGGGGGNNNGGGGNNNGGGGNNNGGGGNNNGGNNNGGNNNNRNNPPAVGVGAGQGIPRNFWDIVASLWNYFISDMTASRLMVLLGIGGGVTYLFGGLSTWFGDLWSGGSSWLDKVKADLNLVKDPNVRAILKKLETLDNDENGLFKLKNVFTFKGPFDSDKPAFLLLTPKEIETVNNYVNTIKNYQDSTLEVLAIEKVVARYGGTLGVGGTEAANIDYLTASIKALKSEYADIQADNADLAISTAEKTAKLAGINANIEAQQSHLSFLKGHTSFYAKLLEDLQENLQDAKDLIANSTFISAGIAGSLFITLLIAAHVFKKRTFAKNSLDTLRTVLALRNKIDALRKNTLLSFPELKVQFTFIDSEIKKCELDSTRKNDILQAYQCSIKYFMGSYALILYAAFIQLSKDGTNVNSFNRLSEIHSYKGFASLGTRRMLEELNSFYDLMIDYDTSLVESFESIFYFIKKQVIENKTSDNIIKSLPYNLAMGRN